MTTRQEKVGNLIKELAAYYIETQTNRTALITVTHATVSKDLKNATIYITVLPEDKEQAVLDFVKRKRADMRNYLKKKMDTKIIPFIDLEIDLGEKNRQLIDRLSKEI
ncbi:hypothetical protein COB64_02700 [Candidatus Wolfebacteria bacterium]|nr:MAG: hypothetical protein COB64_02700 [Candidatus Wolfebacteria bacterium]